MIRRIRITPGTCGLFTPDPGGRLAHYVVARHEDWSFGDIVAWFPNRPQEWWSWRGVFDVLGWPALSLLMQIDHEVPIYRTPATWAAHSGNGIVVLHWSSARIVLANLVLKPEDIFHRKEIERQFRSFSPNFASEGKA